MPELRKIEMTYASDIVRDDFFAEFWCDGKMLGEMSFNHKAAAYEQAYVLTLYGPHSSSPVALSVGELERLLQMAKWRITPIAAE
jgi:hypothetical protein